MSEPKWLEIARTHLGLHEGPGAADNPKVLEFYKLAGRPEIKHDDIAWCAAFVGAMLAKAGLKGTGSLAARDYERWGQKLDKPLLGCVGVKQRAGGQTWQGHVGFVVGANARQIYLLGGNQGDAVSIAAFDRADFTAFRWPAGVAIPASPPPLAASLNAARNVTEA